jgi:hypothetical protein
VILRAAWHGERAWSIQGLCISSLPAVINANGYFAMIEAGKVFTDSLKTQKPVLISDIRIRTDTFGYQE